MFKIVITETKAVKKLEGKKWEVVGTKEVEREERFYAKEKDEPKTRITDVYDYTPEVVMTVEVTKEILSQEVESLDLAKVIKAINNL